MGSRYRRLAESLKQKFRIAPSSSFRPSYNSRNERMLAELASFSTHLLKMQTLVDAHRQAAVKTCGRSRGFITAKAPKQYINGPVGSSVVSLSQDLSYDANAVDVMSTLAEQLEEKLHMEITLPIEKWLGALKEAQKQMVTLDRARLEADMRKRDVVKLESKMLSGNQRPNLRLPGSPDDPAQDANASALNQLRLEQVQEQLDRKQRKLDAALQYYHQQEEQLNERLVVLSQRCSKELQEYQYQLYRLVSDFYRNASDLILPTPAGSSKEFLRRATEKINASSSAAPAPLSSRSPFTDDSSPLFGTALRPNESRASPSYLSSKPSSAAPDIFILDNSPAKRFTSKPMQSPSPSYQGSGGPNSLMSQPFARPPPLYQSNSFNSRAAERPQQSALGRSKTIPAPLSIPTLAAAANGNVSPASSPHQQPAARMPPSMHAPILTSMDHPMQSQRSSATASPHPPASPAAPPYGAPQQQLAHHPAAPGSGDNSRGPGSDTSSIPSDADLLLQQQRVSQLMQGARAKQAAGDTQSAALLQNHAMQQAHILRQSMAVRQAAAAAAATGRDAQQPASTSGAGSSPSQASARELPEHLAVTHPLAGHPATPQQVAAPPPSAATPAAAAAAAAAAPASIPPEMLEAQRQRVKALLQAAQTKHAEGDQATAAKLHQAAMQQASVLKQALQQQGQSVTATPRSNDSDNVPDVSDAAMRRAAPGNALSAQQQGQQAQQQQQLQQQHLQQLQQQQQLQHQLLQQPALQAAGSHPPPSASEHPPPAAAVHGLPYPGMHMPTDDFDEDEYDEDEEDGAWDEEPGGAMYPAITHQHHQN